MKATKLQNEQLLIWKMAFGSALSWELAKWFGSTHPYLAPLSVVLCLRATTQQSILFSYHRVIGTIIGVILTAAIVSYLNMNGWMLGLIILIGTYIAKWLKQDITVLHQVALTIVLIFTLERKSQDYAWDRIRDTLIGAAIAVLIHMLVFPPDYTKRAEASLQQCVDTLSNLLLEMSYWVQFEWGQDKGSDLDHKIQNFLQDVHTTQEMLQKASKSLKYHPFNKKHKVVVSDYQKALKKVSKGYDYVTTTVATFKEWEKAEPNTPKDQIEIGNDLKTLSDYYKKLAPIKTKGSAVPSSDQQVEQKNFLSILQSKLKLNIPYSNQIYRDAFYLEINKLLKHL